MTSTVCVDCGPKPVPRPIADGTGPGTGVAARCATHLREFKRMQGKQARAARTTRERGISGEESAELLLFQEGKCWLCRRATGASKSLAHDHDHKHCSGTTSCRDCLRGRLCSTCNRILGHFRDDPEAFDRIAAYLRGDTPWRRLQVSKILGQRVLGIQMTPNGDQYAYLPGGILQQVPESYVSEITPGLVIPPAAKSGP